MKNPEKFIKISEVTNCGLSNANVNGVTELPFDFTEGSCTVVSGGRAMFCFAKDSTNICYRYFSNIRFVSSFNRA